MLLKRIVVEDDGSTAAIMEARTAERKLRDAALDGLLFVRATGTWQDCNDGELVFYNTYAGPVEKIGTRNVLVTLEGAGSRWLRPLAGAGIEFQFVSILVRPPGGASIETRFIEFPVLGRGGR